MIFPLCFPLPKFASGFFLFPTCSQILMITFFHSLPVFNFGIGFSNFFPFPGQGNEIIHFRTNSLKSFLLTPALAFNNQTGENPPCCKIECIHMQTFICKPKYHWLQITSIHLGSIFFQKQTGYGLMLDLFLICLIYIFYIQQLFFPLLPSLLAHTSSHLWQRAGMLSVHLKLVN